jgi:hypothetical protein
MHYDGEHASMNYYIQRNEQKFGPYSLADLQRYLASGDILPTDLAQSEGGQDWFPVSEIVGNAAVPAAPPPPPGYGQVPAYGVPGVVTGVPMSALQYPAPPELHWALVLLLGFVTCGIFFWVWMFIEAAYVSRIDRENKAMLLYAIGSACVLGACGLINTHPFGDSENVGGVLNLGGIILIIVAHFMMKGSIEAHFTREEPINLRLSGAMTFFFNIIYFQYQFNRINNWRRTGILR